MGMDVYGKNPLSETGEYFRNNVWWWHPLWTYCQIVAPTITSHVKHGHSNDGDGLNATLSKKLAQILFAHIKTGKTAKYAADFEAAVKAIPPVKCKWCNGTGVRSDDIGRRIGMDQFVIGRQVIYGYLHDESHPRFGKIGWCNSCDGVGHRAPDSAGYQFTVDNVEAFANFLQDCGGFAIN